MRPFLPIICAGALAWFGAVTPCSATEDDLADRFGSLPLFRGASLSPGGKYLAFTAQVDGIYNLVVSDVERPGNIKRYNFSPISVERFFWKTDEQLLAQPSWPRGTFVRVTYSYRGASDNFPVSSFLISPALTGRPRPSVRTGRVGVVARVDGIVSLVAGDPQHYYVNALGSYAPDAPVTGEHLRRNVYRVRLNTGEIELVQGGEPPTARWLMDGKDRIVARIDTRPYQDQIFIPSSEGFRLVSTLDYDEKGQRAQLIDVTEDGQSVAVLSRRENNRLGLYSISLADGTWSKALFLDPDHDVAGVIRDERTFRVIGVTYDESNLKSFYLSPERQRLQRDIEAVYPGRSAYIVSTTSDRSKSLVITSGPRNPPALQFVNLNTSHVDTIAETYPQLRGIAFGEPKRHPYTAPDGLVLSGLLTLPPGKEARNLPTIILPPGGFGYEEVGFDWFTQFLVNRGYAVFQAGARDARRLARASGMDEFGAWLMEAQQDIVSSVDDLVAKGIADPKRTCIAGAANDGLASGSGAYLALFAAIYAPDRFACVLTYNAIADLKLIFDDARRTIVSDYRIFGMDVYNSSLVGNSADYTRADMDRFSPAKRADIVRTPLLLIGSNDPQAGPQTRAMRDAMFRAGKRVDFVTLERDDGTLSRAESRIALLKAVDKFLATHIGN